MADNPPDIFVSSLETFDSDVLEASAVRPIMVDFWAEWCPPCLVIAPILEQAVSEYAGGVALAKVEVDEGDNMKLAGRYAVRGFPTVILFEDGVEKGRFSSAQRLDFILDFLDQHIS
jgi:putative thioredoxin